MSGLKRLAGAVVILVLMTGRAQADLIPDPVQDALLAKIAALIQLIHHLRLTTLSLIEQEMEIRQDLYVLPRALFRSIQTTTTVVADMRREVQRLACGWPSSPRVEQLKGVFLKHLTFCRSGYQDVWGSHARFWDGPIQEVNDYASTMTANMISERVEKTNSSWVRASRDIFNEHALLRTSPGEATRAEAAALAWAGEIAVGNSQVVTQDLLIRQLDRSLDRFDQKKAADLAHYTYRGLRTLSGRSLGAPVETGGEP